MKKISKRLLPSLMALVLITSFLFMGGATAFAASAPTNLKATNVTGTSFTLTWDWVDGVSGIYPSGYYVYINGSYYNYSPTNIMYPSDLNPNTTYSVYVVAQNAAGSTSTSNTITVTTPTPSIPLAPTGLTIKGISSTSVSLSWNASAGAASYDVVARVAGVATIGTFNTTSTSYTVTGLSPGAPYSFYVVAKNANGSSGASSTVSCNTTPPVPAPPTNFRVTGYSTTHVSLAWDSVAYATRYIIFRDGIYIGETTAASTTLYFYDPALTKGRTYQFSIRSDNASGSSVETGWLYITP